MRNLFLFVLVLFLCLGVQVQTDKDKDFKTCGGSGRDRKSTVTYTAVGGGNCNGAITYQKCDGFLSWDSDKSTITYTAIGTGTGITSLGKTDSSVLSWGDGGTSWVTPPNRMTEYFVLPVLTEQEAETLLLNYNEDGPGIVSYPNLTELSLTSHHEQLDIVLRWHLTKGYYTVSYPITREKEE